MNRWLDPCTVRLGWISDRVVEVQRPRHFVVLEGNVATGRDLQVQTPSEEFGGSCLERDGGSTRLEC